MMATLITITLGLFLAYIGVHSVASDRVREGALWIVVAVLMVMK